MIYWQFRFFQYNDLEIKQGGHCNEQNQIDLRCG